MYSDVSTAGLRRGITLLSGLTPEDALVLRKLRGWKRGAARSLNLIRRKASNAPSCNKNELPRDVWGQIEERPRPYEELKRRDAS